MRQNAASGTVAQTTGIQTIFSDFMPKSIVTSTEITKTFTLTCTNKHVFS